MTRTFPHGVRIGHAAAKQHSNSKRSNCANFYTSPTAGQVVNTTSPAVFSWDPSLNCFTPAPKNVDIYLYAPNQNNSLIQAFKGADYKQGTYSTTLDPSWWGLTPDVSLQIAIVQADTPAFLSTIPAGPLFDATFNTSDPATSSISSTSDGNIIQTVHNNYNGGGLSKGGIAAAVIFPLLFVALVVAAYVKFTRVKEAEKRKRWSQAVDKRMSTISTDWRTMSGKTASAVIRNSVATGGRASVFFANGGRPSSTFANEGDMGQTGVGARFARPMLSEEEQIRQARARASNGSGLRVSFAADSSRNSSATNRAYHQGFIPDENAPPVPEKALYMSPTQREGPVQLSNDDINEKILDEQLQKEIIEMPAMTMMRTGKTSPTSRYSGGEDDFVLKKPAPTINTAIPSMPPMPPQAHHPASSTMSPTTNTPFAFPPTSPQAQYMTPDDMLKAYAAGRAKTPTGRAMSPPISSPITPSNNGNGMRVLYAPTAPAPYTPTAPSPMPSTTLDPEYSGKHHGQSMYSDGSVYSGIDYYEEEHSYGHAT